MPDYDSRHGLRAHQGPEIHRRDDDGAVRLPQELSGIVLAVIGLDDHKVSTHADGTGDPAGAAPSVGGS